MIDKRGNHIMDVNMYEMELLTLCYMLNKTTDKKVLPVKSPCFLIDEEAKQCVSRMSHFPRGTSIEQALVSMINHFESEFIFLYNFQTMTTPDGLNAKIRFCEG